MDYKERIASNIAKITGLEQAKVSDLIEIPPQMSLEITLSRALCLQRRCTRLRLQSRRNSATIMN